MYTDKSFIKGTKIDIFSRNFIKHVQLSIAIYQSAR